MEIELEDGIYQAKYNIGQGCFGQVKLLVHISTKKQLALKIIDLVTESKTELAYAELEAELLKELSANPIILKYVHHLKSDRQFFLITEYIEGRTLSRDIGNLTMQEAIRIYKQILLGLEFIHGKGICHRDIKPANIMITIQGVLKLIDFGLAERFIDENGEEIMFDHCEGSREHLPPETQTEGECRCHGPSHDIWSSGVVFVECITGLSPWKKADPEEDENYRAWKNNSLTSFWDAIVSAELIPLLRKVLSESIKRPSARKILDWLAETIKQEHKEEGSGLEPSSETRSIKLSDDLEEAFENVDEAENRSGSRDRKRKRSRSRDDDRKKRKSSRDRKRSS